MPTRVIDVGGGEAMHLFLRDKDETSQGAHHVGAHYVALSHCWGKLTEEQKKKWRDTTGNKEDWNTTNGNKERRKQGFLITELPQTFQDAITDDHGDWDTESQKMEAVFKNAYCTIAATSAEDSTKGFLNRPEGKDLQYEMVPECSHGKVYRCTSIGNDFDSDVTKGVLNTRAWVLQERALSRRTIHFTKRQTYWECGGGVRCETLNHMTNPKLSFRSDPAFPRSINNRSKSAQVDLIQSLFADYSKLDLTHQTDKPVAIKSLAKGLANALRTEVRYGTFECFLHRSLLWQPAQDTLTQIDYKANPSKSPPSWSWMAYHGQIQYLPIVFGDVEWDDSIRLVEAKASDSTIPEDDGYVLEARVRRLRDCKVRPEGVKRVILDENDNEVGQLYFDTQPDVWCAIMGRQSTGAGDGKRKYFVLFVTAYATELGDRKFRRVGMGSILKRFILFDGQDDLAQIL